MSDEPKDGGPAFGHGDHVNGGHPGMSLRDWFAGQALGAFITSISAKTAIEALEAGQQGEQFLADCAYDMADAMLAARINTALASVEPHTEGVGA